MPHARKTSLIAAAVALFFSVGCSEEERTERYAAQAAELADSQAPSTPAPPGLDEDENNRCIDEASPIRGELRVQVGDIMVTLEAAEPNPPRRYRENDLTFALTDAATGEPLSSASVVFAGTYMPIHAAAGKPPIIEMLNQGRFMLREVDFKMAGIWLVRFDVKKTATAAPVMVEIPLCVD